jgi:GntR family transcriptional regulator, transcriptional repressor for pyruvate dehydrogenase complex
MDAGTPLASARKGKKAGFQAVRRGHAADTIFEQLAAAILTGELAPGAPLPPERVLGEQFGVSRMVLRQAVHRLADVGLVRVRQGGATLILDPGEAGDIRLIGLYYALDPGGERARIIRRDAIEKQSLQGLSLIDVCARRGSSEEKEQLHALALAFDETAATEADFAAFEETFWRGVSRAGKNRIFEMEVVWWYDTLADGRPAVESATPISLRVAFYRELARCLVAGAGATQYYLAVTSPQLDALFTKEAKDDVR